ncbi:MAG: CoA transferase [Actinobacteria bacterium]|nr:CoA transferase [Actinomycetota bacterium]
MTGLLEGVRVVDLSRVLAGPFAAHVLAEMGATVTKVEAPEGDPAREIGPHADGRSLYFATFNTGKRGVVLDLTDADDRAALDRMLGDVDVLVDNFRPGAARDLGLDPQTVATRHQHLVHVTVSGYARGSERSDEGAFDVTVQAEAGIMAVTGEPGGPPARAGVPISDLAAGLWAALGALGGLVARQRTGRGTHIEIPLLDATLPLLSYMATAALHTGDEPPRVGSGHHEVVPYRAYATADGGWLVVAALADKFWPRLCDALGLTELASDPTLRTGAGRRVARDRVDQVVAGALGRLDRDEAKRRLDAAQVPNAPVLSLLEAIATPYVAARGIVVEVGEGAGAYRLVRGPLHGSQPPAAAPGLGEHQGDLERSP